jgi:hypothetical protein
MLNIRNINNKHVILHYFIYSEKYFFYPFRVF